MISRSTDIRAALRSRQKQRGFIMNPFRFAASGGDPDFALRSLLLHMEGSSFVDSSSNNHSVSAFGATQTTDWAYFGTKSCLVSTTVSNQNRLTIPHHSSFNVGANEFSIELAVRFTSLQTMVVFGKAVATSYFPYQIWVNGDKLGFRIFFDDGSLLAIEDPASLAINTNYFVQARRRNVPGDAAYFELAKNGTQVVASTGQIVSRPLKDNTEVVVVGNFNSGATYATTGMIDMLRFTNSKAEAFAVPTVAFPTF